MLAATVAAVVSCGGPPAEPVIGFTYNWGESGLEEFLEEEVARHAPPGSMRVRVRAGPTSDWRSVAGTMLAGEVNRALALAEDPAVAVVVGPGGSREVVQVAPVYRRARLAHLAPTATSRALADVGEWTFLMAPNDSVQGEFIGAFADSALRARAVSIVYVPDEYGIGLSAGSAAALAARGVALLDRVPIRPSADCQGPVGIDMYDALVMDLARRGAPDVIVVAARSIESACVLQAARKRWPRVRLVTGDGAYVDSAYVHRARGATDEAYFVAFWAPRPDDAETAAFAEGFRRATGRAPRHGDAVFRDAVMVAAEAVHATGGDRELVRAYLAGLGTEREPYRGLAGPVAFSGAVRRELLMTRMVNGEMRVVGRR